MDKNSKKLSPKDCFGQFCENPKEFNLDIIQGAHKFLVEVVRGEQESPKNKTLIELFSVFCEKPIRSYVFSRMGKKIMQELAICILQDLAVNGAGRAATLRLEVVKASAGGKVVKIVDQFPSEDDNFDQSFLDEIDQAIFKFSDPSGKSPDVKFTSGQGLAAPYIPPGEDGAFVTPKKRKSRSSSDTEVRPSKLHRTCIMKIAKYLSHSHTLRTQVLQARKQPQSGNPGKEKIRYSHDLMSNK